MALQPLLQPDGVLWIEPVLTTKARNAQASALMEAGTLDHHPFWSLGLNASGVVLGVADSGIDADHACFRNATSPASPHAESGAAYPLLVSLVSNIEKSSTSTRAWMVTTPPVTAIIATEPTSSVHWPATTLTISAKAKRQATARPWLTVQPW